MKNLVLVLLALVLSSCSNIYEGAANKSTDQALYEDAVKAQNAADYDTAIAKILELQANYASYQTDATTIMLLASAYAGKCGFNFANYFTTITTTSAGTTPLLQWFMNQWTTATTSRTYCRLAENTVKLIKPTYVGRDANQSFFMVLLGMAKMGIYLRELVDTNRDGTADSPAFDIPGTGAFCTAANISDANIADIGTGLSLVVANLTNIGTALSGANIGGLSTACSAFTPNPCLIEDETTFAATAANLSAIRTLLNINTAGVGIGLVNGTACP